MRTMKKMIAGLTLALFAVVAVAPHAEAAYSGTTLVRLAKDGNRGPNLYSYSTSDAIATVEVANYLRSGLLRAGDLVWVKASDAKRLYSVTAATSSTSTLAQVSQAPPVWVCAAGSGYGSAGAVGYIAAPIAGTITKYYHTLTTVVDADVILNLDIGGTNCTGSATIASSGVAVGDVDTATVSANGTVTAGALVKVESDGGGTAGAGTTCIQITP